MLLSTDGSCLSDELEISDHDDFRWFKFQTGFTYGVFLFPKGYSDSFWVGLSVCFSGLMEVVLLSQLIEKLRPAVALSIAYSIMVHRRDCDL